MLAIRTLLLAIILFAVSSCVSLSKEECTSMDWQGKGFEDGKEGESADRIQKYHNACAKYSLKAHEEKYAKGRALGLREFCTKENGYKVGSRGSYYSEVCPLELKAKFLEGYEVGKREHDLRENEEKIRTLQASSTCSSDFECQSNNACTFGKCNDTGEECTFSSDCGNRGRCASRTEWVGTTAVSVNHCENW